MKLRRLALALAVGTLLVSGCESGTGPSSTTPANVVGPDGGTLTVGGVSLQIPPGALAQDEEITATPVSVDSLAVPDGFLLVGGTAYDLRPDGLTFKQPITVTISYDPAALPAGTSPSALQILHLGANPETPATTVNETAATVEAQADHFSVFVVAAPSGPYQTVACPGLAPAASHGQPLDRVELGQLPADFQPPLAALAEVDGDTLTSFGLVSADDQNSAQLVVPIHPSTSPDGGPVHLSITDGTLACPPLDFDIDPLDPAPGELQAIAEGFQNVLDAQEAVLGTSRQELLSTPAADLPQVLIPIALTQAALSDPDNDSSLVAIADGTSSASEAARLDLLEPLLARTGLRSILAAASVSPSATAERPSQVDLGINPGQCTPDLTRHATDLLDTCMHMALDAAFRVNGVVGTTYGDLSHVIGDVGLVPGLEAPAAVAGFVVWLLQTSDSRMASLLPSSWAQSSGTVKLDTFLEDQPGPGYLLQFEATASNVGYDLGKELLNGFLQSSGVAGEFDKYETGLPEVGGVNSVLAYVLTGPVADKILKNAGVNGLDLKPELFGPVFPMPAKWSTAKIIGDAFSLVDSVDYDPEKVGTAHLVVTTKPDKFGGQQATWQTSLTVKRLQMSISPTEVFLAPGDSLVFDVDVTDALYPKQIATDVTGLQGTAEQPDFSATPTHSTVKYKAPMKPDVSKPDLLVVRDTAKTGARGKSQEPRMAIATIHFGQLTIFPRSACLNPGDTLQFTADVKGLTDQTVEWSASAGSIDPQTGLYVASPPADGAVTITAHSTQNAEIKDQVTIQVGHCDCNWTVLVDGNEVSSDSTDTAGFVVNNGGYLGGILLTDTQGGQTVGINPVPEVAGQPGIPIGTTGDLKATVAGLLGLSPQDLDYTGGDLALTLTENDGQSVVSGVLSGTVKISSVADPANPRSGNMSASFRIVSDGNPLVAGTQTTYMCTVGSGG